VARRMRRFIEPVSAAGVAIAAYFGDIDVMVRTSRDRPCRSFMRSRRCAVSSVEAIVRSRPDEGAAMTKLSLLALALCAAAGCTGTPSTPTPAADPEGVAGPTAAPLALIPKPPCGYRLVYDATGVEGNDHSDWNATITYDAHGLDIAENAVDAAG